MSGVECCYLGSVNYLCYADDIMVLLSPTPQGLEKLFDICADYASNHDIMFNTKKPVCMSILPLFSMVLVDIVSSGNVLSMKAAINTFVSALQTHFQNLMT